MSPPPDLNLCHVTFLKRPKIWVGRGPETPNRLRVALRYTWVGSQKAFANRNSHFKFLRFLADAPWAVGAVRTAV